jgi:hypothetical protein
VITARLSSVSNVNTTLTNVLKIVSVNATTTKRRMKKPFDVGLYQSDDNAKYDIINWLHANDFYAWVNPDQYGIDVLAFKDWSDYGFEVEIKHNWKGQEFPFKTVHFSARKQKFIAPNHYFTMLNDDRSYVLVVDGPTLLAASVVSKETKYTTDEQFIAVPIHRCQIFRLD